LPGLKSWDHYNAHGKPWAFSNGNAGTRYTPFYDDVGELDVLDWESIAATNWRDPFVKERKQAEFLVHESFPWELVERIGVIDNEIGTKVTEALAGSAHTPPVVVMGNWYY